MDERLTIKQVLMMTRDMLRNIGTIPLEETEHIGSPVNAAIRNLEECIRAISEDEKRTEEQKIAKETNDGNSDS